MLVIWSYLTEKTKCGMIAAWCTAENIAGHVAIISIVTIQKENMRRYVFYSYLHFLTTNNEHTFNWRGSYTEILVNTVYWRLKKNNQQSFQPQLFNFSPGFSFLVKGNYSCHRKSFSSMTFDFLPLEMELTFCKMIFFVGNSNHNFLLQKFSFLSKDVSDCHRIWSPVQQEIISTMLVFSRILFSPHVERIISKCEVTRGESALVTQHHILCNQRKASTH